MGASASPFTPKTTAGLLARFWLMSTSTTRTAKTTISTRAEQCCLKIIHSMPQLVDVPRRSTRPERQSAQPGGQNKRGGGGTPLFYKNPINKDKKPADDLVP